MRNLLVHEYIESPIDMLPALAQARDFVGELHVTFQSIRKYVDTHLGMLDS